MLTVLPQTETVNQTRRHAPLLQLIKVDPNFHPRCTHSSVRREEEEDVIHIRIAQVGHTVQKSNYRQIYLQTAPIDSAVYWVRG